MQGTFRREAIEAASQKALSRAEPLYPNWVRSAGILLVIASCVCLALVLSMEYSPKVAMSGLLEPDSGMIRVYAPRDGLLSSVEVDIGDHVVQGRSLFTIKSPTVDGRGIDASRAANDSSETRRARLLREEVARRESELRETAHLAARRADAVAKLQSYSTDVGLKDEQISMATDIVVRLEKMVDSKYVSDLQLIQHKQALIDLMASKKTLERERSDARQAIELVDFEMSSAITRQALERSRIEAELVSLKAEEANENLRSGVSIRSPRGGVVTAIVTKSDKQVKAGDLILEMMPSNSRLVAALHVPEQSIDAVKVGVQISIRVRAFPYQRYGQLKGRVVQVSKSPMIANSAASGDAESDRFYLAVATIETDSFVGNAKNMILLPGMVIEVSITEEELRLYQMLASS